MDSSTALLFESIAKLFFLSALGYLAVHFRILSTDAVEGLSRFIIGISGIPNVVALT